MKVLFLGASPPVTAPASRARRDRPRRRRWRPTSADRGRAREADSIVAEARRRRQPGGAEYSAGAAAQAGAMVATGIDDRSRRGAARGQRCATPSATRRRSPNTSIMTMLVWRHQLFTFGASFRAGSWATSWAERRARTARSRPDGRHRRLGGSGARWRAAPRRSAFVCWPPTAARWATHAAGRAGLSAGRARPDAAGMRCRGDCLRPWRRKPKG